MKALSIRNLPDDIYLAFSQMCAQNQRSMQEQARLMIEREVRLAASPGLSVAKQWRERLANRVLGDTVQDMQLGRDRP